jgi:hypothetical protein
VTRYRFAAELPEELGRELQALAVEVRAAERPSRLAGRGADLILRLTEANLDYYFIRSARRLDVGMVSQSAIRLGLRTAMGGISVFVKGLAHALSDDQVRRLAELLDEMLIVEEET